MKDLFPYETVRDTQKDLKKTVEEVIQNADDLVTHAPTGLGKTAATIPPALAYALKNNKKVFFLTSRHSQHEIALETLREIKQRHDVSFTSADLIGKRHLCEGGSTTYVEEDQPECPRHDKTYTDSHQLTTLAKRRVKELKNKVVGAEDLPNHCTKVCPYEVAMHMAGQADVVIGDYFHIFHPGVRDAVLGKSGKGLTDCIIIVDEAHNLPDRTRSLHSATLTDSILENGIKEARRHGFYPEEELLERIGNELDAIVRNELGMERETRITKETVKDRVSNIQDYESIIEDLHSVAKEVTDQGEESVCDDIATFFERWNGEDNGFVRVLKKQTHRNKTIHRINYRCLNPMYATRDPIRTSHTTIAMSGTLKPLDMYTEILGFDEDNTRKKAYTSPFPKENRLNLIVDKVTTRYKERSDEMYQKIAWYILKSIEQIPGNTGVFFPSYKFRDSVYDTLKDRIEKPAFLEDRRMDKDEKNKFLKKFGDKTDKGAVLFGVVGGSFGEGIDFPGDLMKAVFVVGVPLQRPDLETKALIEFYDEKFGKGWAYGYNYPAINRAVQAAGRCIRSSQDKGAVVFMDKRYKWSKYRETVPSTNLSISKAPWQDIQAFFNS